MHVLHAKIHISRVYIDLYIYINTLYILKIFFLGGLINYKASSYQAIFEST